VTTVAQTGHARGRTQIEAQLGCLMLKSLTIRNFKCLRKLSFPTLKRVNLVAGKNNTGKTTVLEALLLLLEGPLSVGKLPGSFRNCANIGDMVENYWKWVFTGRYSSAPVVIEAETDDYPHYSVAISLQNPPQDFNRWKEIPGGIQLSVLPQKAQPHAGVLEHPPSRLGVVALTVRPTDPQKDAVDYDRVVLKKEGEERLEALLRKIEPRLRSLRSIKSLSENV